MSSLCLMFLTTPLPSLGMLSLNWSFRCMLRSKVLYSPCLQGLTASSLSSSVCGMTGCSSEGGINEVIVPPPAPPPPPCHLLLCSCVARTPGKGFLLTQWRTVPLVSSFGSSRMGWEPTFAFARHWSQVDSHLSQITHPLLTDSQGCAEHWNLNS